MSDTAKRLLTNFNQGDIVSVEVTTISGAGPFDPPSEAVATTTLQGVSNGVSSEYVDGVNILSTDLMVTLEPTDIDVGSRLTMDGREVSVLRVMRVPPSGVTVVTRVLVRGGGGVLVSVVNGLEFNGEQLTFNGDDVVFNL